MTLENQNAGLLQLLKNSTQLPHAALNLKHLVF